MFQLEVGEFAGRSNVFFQQLCSKKHVRRPALRMLLRILPVYLSAHCKLTDFKILPFYACGLQVAAWLLKNEIDPVEEDDIFRGMVICARSGIFFLVSKKIYFFCF
jgi:hypothetical protein